MTLPRGSRQENSGNLPPMRSSARRDTQSKVMWGVVSAMVGVFLLGLAYHGLAGRRYMTAAGPPVLIKITPETTRDQAPTSAAPETSSQDAP